MPKKQTMMIINFKKKKMKVSTNKQQKSHKKVMLTLKNVIKLQIIAIMQMNIAHSICNLKYSKPKETIAIFHDGSKYDYHFSVKELGEEFEGQFTCLGENTEKYTSYRKRRFGKNGNKMTKVIFWKLIFFDSTRFMKISSSDLVNKLTKLNVNMDMIIKNTKRVESNKIILTAVLNTETLKMT